MGKKNREVKTESKSKSKSESERKADPTLVSRGDDLWNLALQQAGLGYQPNRGIQVAAFSPTQEAAFAGTNQAASAFGMPTSSGTGMPEPTTTADGFRGYSTGGIYDDMISKLPPEFRDGLTKFFADINAKAQAPAATPAAAEETAKPATGGDADMRRVRALEQPLGSKGGGMTAADMVSSTDPGMSAFGKAYIDGGVGPGFGFGK